MDKFKKMTITLAPPSYLICHYFWVFLNNDLDATPSHLFAWCHYFCRFFWGWSLRDHTGKEKGKRNDIMQKGGRVLHPNHYLRTLRNNDKSSMRGGQGYCHFFKFIHSFLGPDIPCVTISLDWGLVRTHSLRLGIQIQIYTNIISYTN